MDKKGNLFYSGYSGLTYNDIGNFIGKEIGDNDRGEINSLISSLELLLARQCNRNFLHTLKDKDGAAHSYYEVFDAGKINYFTANIPLKEAVKIQLGATTLYDKTSNSNTYLLNTDFFVHDDRFEFTVAPQGESYNQRALTLYYNIEEFWGDEVKLAIKKYASEIYLQKEWGGKNVKKFAFNGYTVDFADREVPAYFRDIVSTYKKPII